MVLINGRKFACQSCIKGHRSSNCSHTDRPLFEIRKKGRPVTQCDTCRELRTTKKLHVKCICDGRRDPEAEVGPVEIQSPRVAAAKRRPGRKIPLVPTLPNGVTDVDMISPSPATASSDIPSDQSPRMAPDSESLASPMASWDQADGAMLSSPLSTAGPTRSCCGRKKHSPAGPVPTAQGDIQILAKRTIQQPLSIQSPAIIPITAPLSTPSDQPHATHRVSDVSTEMMDCLCGPDCVCLGCTKHGNKTSDDGHLPGTQGMDCPVDCPSCIDNEHGGAWPTSSFYPASNHQWNASTSGSRSFTFYPSLSTNPHAQYASTSMSESDMMGGEDTLASLNFGAGLDWLLDPDAEGDYDPDLDAEGSPNPDYIDLPAFTIEESGPSSATKTHPQVEADPKSQINHQMECCTNKECC